MGKGKYLRKPNISKTKSKPKFKMPKHMREKIDVLMALSVVVGGLYGSIAATPAYATANETQPTETPVEETSQVCTIGIANANAEITVDGRNYKIDNNSFVIVSEDNALAYDESGNLLKGYISNNNFKEVMEITEAEMSNYNIYQVISDSAVNVRSTGEIEENNIISTVSSLDYVLGYSQNTLEYDEEWIYTLSLSEDNIYEGYIREDLIQDIGTFDMINDKLDDNYQNNMFVNTELDGFIDLNLRTYPNVSDEQSIMTKIPHGSTVHIIGETTRLENRDWIRIEYKSPDGPKFQGWIVERCLSNFIVEKPEVIEVQEYIPEVKTNANGSVTGIDVSTISPDALRELLQSKIPQNVQSVHGNYDTSQLAGDINYVYIKLGSSGYGKGSISTISYDNYIDQVAICEELGIPYGFYYYSTAITVEEAQVELDCIKQRIEELREKFDMQYNNLEIAVDIELVDENDRQFEGDIKEKTEAKAALINGIQEEGLSDNVLIYGPARVMKSTERDQIVNLQYLHSLLANPDDVNLWLCSLMHENGNLKKQLEDDIAYAEEQGFSTVAFQLVLDAKVNGYIDINDMDLEHFEKLLIHANSKTNSKTNSTNDLDEMER